MEFQGYRLGVRANDDQIYVSQARRSAEPAPHRHPRRLARQRRRAPVDLSSSARRRRAEVSKTYHLKGDRMPFLPDEMHSTFGNVGPLSALK
jgi:hypothetical protein